MTLDGLSITALTATLAQGLALRTGPFRFKIESSEPSVARGLSVLYGGFPLDAGGGFHDFHVRVDRVAGPRRWLRPQVNFWMDGVAPFKPLPVEHAFPLLEWGVNWCIASQAHHYLLLHAAVLEHSGRCIILPGDPGAGKSTLTAALMLGGWRLLSDEMTIIDRDDGGLVPLARPVSLKNRSIDVIRNLRPEAVFGEIARDTHKGTVSHLRPSALSVARMADKGRPAHIVFPRWEDGAQTALKPGRKADAFMHSANHAFNYSLLGRSGFEMNAALIDACDCWDFRYSQLPQALRVFEDLAA